MSSSLGATSLSMYDFWHGKRVLVTGHTGFKGAWLCLWLQHLGAEVVGYSLAPPTEPSLFKVARVSDAMHSIEADIRDLQTLTETLSDYRPEIVLHLAAQAIVRRSYEDPIETFSSNVVGTYNLLEAVRTQGGVRVVVTVTSDKCYENVEKTEGYREGDGLGGRDPYSASKACAEIVANSYQKSYFAAQQPAVAAATARAGNVIGGGDWGQDRLVPDLMRSLLAGETLHIRFPEAVRPWQFVLDPLRGYLTLAERLWDRGQEVAGPWNFAPSFSERHTVGDLVDRIVEIWGEPVKIEKAPGPHPHEHNLLLLDPSKAGRELDWKSVADLERTISWIAEWYRGYRDGSDPRALSLHQIDTFMGLGTS